MSARRVLLLCAVVALSVFGALFWSDIVDAFTLMRTADWKWLLLLIPIQGLNFLAHAMFFRSALKAIDAPVPSLARLYKLSLAVSFTNIVVPSAGAAGVSLMAASLKRDAIKGGVATFIQLARYGAVYVSYILLLLFALISLLLGEDVTTSALVIVGAIILNTLIVTILGIYLVYDRRAFRWLFRSLQRLVDWVARKFRNGRDLVGIERIQRITDDFFSGVRRIVKDRAYFKQPFWWSLFGNSVEVLSLYIVFVALDFVVNPGVVVIAFAIASGVGILTVIPGDIGVYEFAMVATLSLAGVPLAIGISATILFRVINRLIILPFGFFFYNQIIGEVTDGTDT